MSMNSSVFVYSVVLTHRCFHHVILHYPFIISIYLGIGRQKQTPSIRGL